MQVIPSIHVLGGKIVKLHKGDFKQADFYESTPLDVARRFELAGLTRLHIVDLDGVTHHRVVNDEILRLIKAYTNMTVDYSGGVRTGGALQNALSYGASTVTVSTVAALQRELFYSWIISFGQDKLIVGTDVQGEKIVTHGWTSISDISVWEHLDYYYERGQHNVKITDITSEGQLAGPSLKLYEEAQKRYPRMRFFVSGGVSSLDDIKKLMDINIHGVIIGKAFHDGVLDPMQVADLIGATPSKA